MSNKPKEAGDPIGSGSGISLSPITKDQAVPKLSTARIWKNIIAESLGFLCLFTAFSALSNLQSSINKDQSLGTNGLAAIYGTLVISNLLLPPIIIARLGCKWTIAFSMLCYILYMVANYYVRYYTLIPSAVILGLGAATLWTANSTYITEIGVLYAKQTGKTRDGVINNFFGVFFMMMQTSQIWGNLISSMVFETSDNTTISEEDLLTCGANFCPSSDDGNNTNLDRPSDKKVFTVYGIYIGFAVFAFLIIAIGLDPVTLDRDEEKTKSGRQGSMNLVLGALRHMWRSHYQKLLIPLSMYNGIEQAFMTGDYTRSYIACALGIKNIGFVMICYAVFNCMSSLVFGRLVKYFGHIPFFVLAFLLHGGSIVFFLMWQPDPDRIYMFYIFAAFWGMGDSVFHAQINALHGLLWIKDSEAAFANFGVWASLGFIIAFALQGYLCTDVKLYIALGFLCVGMLGYGTVEFDYRRNENIKNIHL